MKAVDSCFGCLLATLLPVPSSASVPDSPRSFLLIRPGGIGDAVLLAPAITSLRRQCPDSRITLLAERRNAGVFALIPAVDQLYCYDNPIELLQVMGGRYDVVIDTEQWHRLSAIVARMVCAPTKIGFDTNDRRRMFTHSVSYSHDTYEADSFLRLLEPVTGMLKRCACSDQLFLSVPAQAAGVAARLLEPLADKNYIVIFPGASIAERRWGAERFRAVAEGVMRRGYGLVVVGAESDRLDGEAIVHGNGLNLAGKTSLAETAAVLSRALLLISGDSGILHLAVGLGIPTVSLFGPGRSLKWAPRGERHIVINRHLDCSPCTTFGSTPTCPYAARCMQEIAVDEVISAALQLLPDCDRAEGA